MRSQVLSALRWATLAKFTGQVISWGITIFVIRLLAPGDYGLMAIGTLFIGLMTLIGELGLGAALIQKKETDSYVLKQVFGMVTLIYLLLAALLFSVAPWIALYFDMPQLGLVIRVLCLEFVFMIFLVIPQAQLERELAFRQKSIVELFATLVGSVTTLVLAWLGYGVWALVIGSLTITFIKVAGLNVIEPYLHWPVFHFRGIGRIFSFGGGVTLERVLWYGYAQADTFIIGKILGKELVGFYSVAIHLASLPMQKVNGIINQVAFPAFSRVQTDDKQVAYYLEKAFRVMATIAFPVFFGMSSVTPELVGVVLGDKWLPAIVPMQLLCLVMPLRALQNLVTPAVRARGRPGLNVSNLLIALIIMSSAFVIGSQWGLLGVSLAWLVAYPFVFLIEMMRALPVCGTGLRPMVLTLYKPAVMASIMYLAVLGLRWFAEGRLAPAVILVMLIFGGALTYAALIWLWNRAAVLELKDLLQR